MGALTRLLGIPSKNRPSKDSGSGSSGSGSSGSDSSSGGSSDSGFYGSGVTSYHSGGTVRKTGMARLRKGEKVLTKTQQKRMMMKDSGKKMSGKRMRKRSMRGKMR